MLCQGKLTQDLPLLESSLEISQSHSIVIFNHKATDITYFRAEEDGLIGRAINSGTDSSSWDEDGDFDFAKGRLGQRFRLGTYSDSEGVRTESEKVISDEELGSTDLFKRRFSTLTTAKLAEKCLQLSFWPLGCSRLCQSAPARTLRNPSCCP